MKGKRGRELRAAGHRLPATVSVGRTGLTDAGAAEVAAQLQKRGLVKVRISPEVAREEDRQAMAAKLADRACGEVVEVRGFTILLARRRKGRAQGERE